MLLRARDPEGLAAWYARHLGVPFEGGFAKFLWADDGDPNASTAFATFDHVTDYFGPSGQQVMINFRVDDLEALLAALADAKVEIVPDRYEDAFGKFAWIVDGEGNRVELWEPPGRP